MRFASNHDTKNFLGVADMICSDFLLSKSGGLGLSKTRSPGRFPEGKVWFPVSHPGRFFIMFPTVHDSLCYNYTFLAHFDQNQVRKS